MASVGLLYVGVVLFINGLALLGFVRGNGAVPLNIFVGLLQVITPTYLIFTANGDPDVIFGASGLYLFGFTYLYVAMNGIWGFDGTGVGWFSLFVAVAAVGYAIVNAVQYQDWAFTVIWLMWAYLWWLFFVLFGLDRPETTAYTGAVTAIEGWVTAAIPAFLILSGAWDNAPNWVWAVAVLIIHLAGFAWARAKYGENRTTLTPTPA